MKRMPGTCTILLAILVVVIAISWLAPTIRYEMTDSSEGGFSVIDETTVEIHRAKGIALWRLPELFVNGVEKVFSTIVLITACNCAFAVLSASDIFTQIISRLCHSFRDHSRRLLLLILGAFSLLGLVVPPHCFVAFVPLMCTLSIRLGYDDMVGLALVLFGATTASMSGPLSAVTAMCQECLGLPVYSGVGVRFICFGIFFLATAAYLVIYAGKIRREPESLPTDSGHTESESIGWRSVLGACLLVAVFALVVYGTTALSFGTMTIAGVFLCYAILVGPVLGFNLDKTMEHMAEGVRRSASTIIVISLAGAVTVALEESGIMGTIVYLSYRGFSRLPGVLLPVSMLVLISLLNCLLPSGPAKGVMVMPLLAPAAQMAGMSMQTSVLAYNLGDSITNYLLPYDATTASYLAAANVPFQRWIKFVLKLFFLWYILSVLCLTILYYTGYGPF
ncbi:MAG: AbgT family transporter [Oscillospiraceae bacterium]|nr:AbgT family transporter [Oscillospiraceae bacterium]